MFWHVNQEIAVLLEKAAKRGREIAGNGTQKSFGIVRNAPVTAKL
jgi:hypothetical protein